MTVTVLLETMKTLFMLWHVIAFAIGGVYVWQSYKVVLGQETADPTTIKFWNVTIRKADWHLWLSGFAIIGVGLLLSGVEHYLSNPKLWCKVTVVVVWLLSTQSMRHYAAARLRQGVRAPMLSASALNLACWAYGAFLGCAKGLAYGAVPYVGFLAGFILTVILCGGLTYAAAMRRNPQSIR